MQSAVPEGVGGMAAVLGLDDDAVRAAVVEPGDFAFERGVVNRLVGMVGRLEDGQDAAQLACGGTHESREL